MLMSHLVMELMSEQPGTSLLLSRRSLRGPRPNILCADVYAREEYRTHVCDGASDNKKSSTIILSVRERLMSAADKFKADTDANEGQKLSVP
jgi:hypothetical protein